MRIRVIKLLERILLLLTPTSPIEASTTPRLLPLTPEYQEDQHGLYFRLIEDGLLRGTDVRNIALTGSYGVGKSSILTRIAEEHDAAIYISLSTLGQSTAADPTPEDGSRPSIGTTNLIQRKWSSSFSTARTRTRCLARGIDGRPASGQSEERRCRL